MSGKTTKKQASKGPESLPLTVRCATGRRFRAGLEFGPVARAVEVTPEQAALIEADPLLSVGPSSPAPLPEGEGRR